MTSRYAENPLSRALPWIAGFVLLAGVVAFSIAYFGRDSSAPATAAGPTPVSGQAETVERRRSVPFAPEARQVIAEFLETAVPRKNLRRSYEITHPELRQGMSLKEWLTGTIPVQYYPTGSVQVATFKIDESYADEAVVEVALLPRKGVKVKPQIFFVGVKKHQGEWLVNYFAPRSTIPVPVTGDS